MNVTPQLIEQIDFSEKFHGYDPDQVDDFLEQVGTTLTALQAKVENLSGRVQRAESEASALRDQPPPAPVEARSTAMTDEEDAAAATSTLLLAKRTAQAAIDEARQEAAQLLSDARTRAETQTTEASAEADRLVRDAQAQREDMLQRAREDADREKVAQRDQLLEEIAGLDRRKTELVTDIGRLEERIAEYRQGLEQVHGAIRTVLDDPTALRSRASLDMTVDEPPTSSAFYYTGSNPVVAAAESIPLAVPDTDADADAEPEVAAAAPTASSAKGSTPPEPTGTADPWAPGSWSEVSAAFEEAPEATSTTLFEAPTPPPIAEPIGQQAAASPFDQADDDVFEPAQAPTEAITRTDIESDHYLQDLDRAVNRSGTDDRAMTEFFEADAEDTAAGRRFGRRR